MNSFNEHSKYPQTDESVNLKTVIEIIQTKIQTQKELGERTRIEHPKAMTRSVF